MRISDFGFQILDWARKPFADWCDAIPSAIRHPPSDLVLAWRPFLDPAPIDRYWLWFLPPLILVIAVVYRTIKSEDVATVPRRAGYLAFQIGVFIVLAAVLLWLLLLFV